MENFLLTFELEENEAVFIHGDLKGLKSLAKNIQSIIDNLENGKQGHEHLFTEDFGGCELSNETQSETSKIINHVKIFGWK